MKTIFTKRSAAMPSGWPCLLCSMMTRALSNTGRLRHARATVLAFVLALFAGSAQAQWFSTTYALKGGWNAIYLHGDATHATPDVLFPNSGQTAGVEEVWRWNPKSNQIQFTETPLIPAPGTPEWNVWKRGLPAQSNLLQMTGQTAYLVKCTGTAATAYSVPIIQKAMPPAATWIRSGANLLGFPSKLNGAAYPSFSTYFEAFPAATTGGARIYKYVGGDLSFSNPIQVFSTTSEQLDRNKAYWFEAEVVGNFYAPLNISLSQATGLDFGRNGSVVTALVRNTTSANITLTLTPVASLPAPAGQDVITGQVPLTRRTFDTGTAAWTETPVTAAYTEVVGANSSVELSFGINRAAMSTTSNALYASLLRLTDSANLFDISLPASARVASMAGLWVGDATVTGVSTQVQSTATAKAVLTDGVVTGIEVTGGGFGYGSVPVLEIASPDGVPATATATISVTEGKVTGLTLTNPGSGYALPPTVTIAAPAGGTAATAVATVKSGIVTGLAIADGGSGYSTAPAVTMTPPQASTVQAVASATLTADKVTSVSVTNPGSGYFTPPTITVAAPAGGTAATAVAEVSNGRLRGITVLNPGSGYAAAPVVTVDPPPARTAATAAAIVQNGKVTGFTITGGGSGYLAAPAITIPAPVPPGSATARTPGLRVLLHVNDGGTASLLSQVFIGTLLDGSSGLCTKESGLKPAEIAGASRIVAAHLPLGRVLTSGSGAVAPGQTLVRTVNIPFDDDVNPFVHRYHPDHNNKDARGAPLGAGAESYGITRTLNFAFTATPPAGVSATGWGSTSIGGNYTEVIRGLHKKDLTVTGTFVLRRASEAGTLSIQ